MNPATNPTDPTDPANPTDTADPLGIEEQPPGSLWEELRDSLRGVQRDYTTGPAHLNFNSSNSHAEPAGGSAPRGRIPTLA